MHTYNNLDPITSVISNLGFTRHPVYGMLYIMSGDASTNANIHYSAGVPVSLQLDTAHLDHLPNHQDRRLHRIEHQTASTAILAAHQYSHDTDGTMTQWLQERSGHHPRAWHFGSLFPLKSEN